MSAYLLDISVLLPLLDPRHIHHRSAHQWFDRVARSGWATCPLTENGIVRIISHPTYLNRLENAPAALRLLRTWCASGGHHFWPDDLSLRDVLDPGHSFTHNHLTDLYLLALAVHHGGKLATFDQRISPSLITGGRDAMVIVPT